ncbi:DUF1194 domain-containing protein [Thalassococcus lentus]|uniref:DUF1194 domain-containing protein n=1 Tax=Thalassococcus lentus TaxID=1210524 RepID=UPI002FE1D98A
MVATASSATAQCRQALAMALDVSGSVDAREYRLQVDGLAAALLHPEVRDAFLALPDSPVRLSIFEWSGVGAQRELLGWTEVRDSADLSAIADQLRLTQRMEMPDATALGAAKVQGAATLRTQMDCQHWVLDISGDGKSNEGPAPQDVRLNDVTVNALVIGEPETGGRSSPGIGELSSYFNAYVIEGRGAFVETALGFQAYESAMVRKLKRELQVLILSAR